MINPQKIYDIVLIIIQLTQLTKIYDFGPGIPNATRETGEIYRASKEIRKKNIF